MDSGAPESDADASSRAGVHSAGWRCNRLGRLIPSTSVLTRAGQTFDLDAPARSSQLDDVAPAAERVDDPWGALIRSPCTTRRLGLRRAPRSELSALAPAHGRSSRDGGERPGGGTSTTARVVLPSMERLWSIAVASRR